MLRSIKIINFIFNESNSFLIKNDSKISQCVKNNLLWQRMISVGTNRLIEFETEVKKPKRKTERVEKIMLIYPNDSVTVIALENAVKLAKRRNLQLVNVKENDSNTGRSVYKLLSTAEVSKIINEDDKDLEVYKNENFKSTKLFIIKDTICEHDLNIKINNMNKALKKNCMVKILLNHSNEDQENVLKMIKNKVEGNMTKEQKKKNATTLLFLPLLDVKSNSSETDSDAKLS